MKAKNKYASPESQVFELKMRARILDGSPYGEEEEEPKENQSKFSGYNSYSI